MQYYTLHFFFIPLTTAAAEESDDNIIEGTPPKCHQEDSFLGKTKATVFYICSCNTLLYFVFSYSRIDTKVFEEGERGHQFNYSLSEVSLGV